MRRPPADVRVPQGLVATVTQTPCPGRPGGERGSLASRGAAELLYLGGAAAVSERLSAAETGIESANLGASVGEPSAGLLEAHMLESLLSFWPVAFASLTFFVDVAATFHAVLYKRDVRAAIGWVGVVWFVPIVGGAMYFAFGINRIQRRARMLRRKHGRSDGTDAYDLESCKRLPDHLPSHLQTLAHLVHRVTERPLLAGNLVKALGCDQAYEAMLEAVESAESSITLQTYIFDNDRAGQQFTRALAAARDRGVRIRVLIDGVGMRYSWPSIKRTLQRQNIPVAAFLPKLVPWKFHYANLRNHRKIMVVDGRVGFTGGMNIREGHCFGLDPKYPIEDMQFRLEGPVVAQLQSTFVDDWAFTTQEVLSGAPWFVPLEPAGEVLARGIPDGPDEDFEELRLVLLGAITSAKQSLRIVTPYFLPDSGLVGALNVAAMRGVNVEIILPAKGNLALVEWASRAQLWQVLERGCRIWLTPAPFDHSKLMIIDDSWSLFGSANWDPRSLRLNFEFNVECYDKALACELNQRIARKRERAHELTMEEVDGRPLPIRLRDGVARLASPYL